MATYKITGSRYLRQYTEASPSPMYAANVQAEAIVRSFCELPWTLSQVKKAQMTYHTDDVVDVEGTKGYDKNAEIRETFDAAMWCSTHSGGMHRAYANAAVYRWTLPDDAVGSTVSSLKVRVTSDPYNSAGVRLHLFTNSTGDIPMSCRTLRGEDALGVIIDDGTTAAGVAPRTTKTIDGKAYWYPTAADVTIEPTGGLTAQKYLFLLIALEDYSVVRGNWIEGSAFIDNLVELVTSAAVTGWTDGETYDLSTPPSYAHEYKVAVDGVYPCVLDGDSGVKSITLQKNGDPLVRKTIPSEQVGTDTLRLLKNGTFTGFLDVRSDQITAIHQTRMYHGSSSYTDYLVIGGTFNSGTFTEIPGLYLYNLTDQCWVNRQSLGELVPGELRTFHSGHGGILCCHFVYFGTDGNRIGFYIVAKDGRTFKNTSPGKWTAFAGNSPAFIVQRIGADVFQAVDWPVNGSYYTTITTANLLDYMSGSDASFKTITIGGAYHDGYTSQLSGRCIIFGSVVSDSKIRSFMILITGFGGALGNTPAFTGSACWSNIISFSGTAYDVTSVGFITFLIGDFSNISSVDTENNPIVYSTGTFSVKIDNSNPWTSYQFNVGRSALTNSMPDTFNNIKIHPGIKSGALNGNSILISGDFSDFGISYQVQKLARFRFNTTEGSVGLSQVTVPVDYTPPQVAALNVDDESVYFAQISTRNDSVQYYDHVHTDITPEQSVAGFRALYASLYMAKLASVLTTQGPRPGAIFAIRGDTLEVPTGATSTVNVPTWQLTVSNLVVPFAMPTAWKARKLRLSWAEAPTHTAGAKINCYMKPEYVEGNPRLADLAIYEASKGSVDGWKLLGSFSPDATISGVSGYAVDFDLDSVDWNGTTGRTASLLLTAYINLDDVNPEAGAGGGSDTPSLPQGVGTANVNAVTGAITDLDTGFRPDITLFG